MKDQIKRMWELFKGTPDEHAHDTHKVVRKYPMKKEWKAMWNNLQKAGENANKAVQLARKTVTTHEKCHELFWGVVENEVGKGLHLQYNEQEDMIEVLEDADSAPHVKTEVIGEA